MIDRTYTDEITPERDGTEITIAGHVHELRDLGGLLFVIVRDRKGCLQVVVKDDEIPDLFERASHLIVRTSSTYAVSFRQLIKHRVA